MSLYILHPFDGKVSREIWDLIHTYKTKLLNSKFKIDYVKQYINRDRVPFHILAKVLRNVEACHVDNV